MMMTVDDKNDGKSLSIIQLLLDYEVRAWYTVSEAINVIMCRSKKEKICKERPLRVRKNAAFLVDVKSQKHWEDIKDDMNGTYNKVLRCGVWTVQCDVVSDDHVTIEVIAKKRVELDGDHKYHMIIHSISGGRFSYSKIAKAKS